MLYSHQYHGLQIFILHIMYGHVSHNYSEIHVKHFYTINKHHIYNIFCRIFAFKYYICFVPYVSIFYGIPMMLLSTHVKFHKKSLQIYHPSKSWKWILFTYLFWHVFAYVRQIIFASHVTKYFTLKAFYFIIYENFHQS